MADGYERFLKQKVLPELRAIHGYRGGYIFRKDDSAETGAAETEFVVINLFESLEALKQFAGPDYTVAVFEPEAKEFLSRIEDFATHYEVRAEP